MFLFLKLFILIYDFFARVTCAFLASKTAKKFPELNTLSRKITISFYDFESTVVN